VDTLLKAQHPNVVTVREIVVGSNMDKIYMVMDYVEHDLKSLMQYGMKKPFLMSEVKTLMQQLLSGIAHLHDNWIIHRDLKTSNLLLSHKGVLKIADFGLAREYGSPLKEYTPIVVTLWYRCPELLLNTKKYSTSVDMWSVGAIFGELMTMKALFPGKNEMDQLNKIFKDLGTPTDKIWPGFNELPLSKKLNLPQFPYNTLRSRFGNYLSDKGFELINKLLTYDPARRISAEEALKNEFFKESPLPIDATIFPTWPAKSEGFNKNKAVKDSEPRAPSPGKMYEQMLGDAEDGFVLQNPIATGFTLR
jgi:cell division cycle 2-like